MNDQITEMNNQITESTKREIERLLSISMQQITSNSLEHKLAEIGYKIDGQMCLVYLNTSNTNVYRAKSINYKHIVSGKGWASMECDKTNLPLLQQIRLDYFVVSGGRIWEL